MRAAIAMPLAALLSAAMLPGCATRPPAATAGGSSDAPVETTAIATANPLWPIGAAYRTTAGAIYLDNLSARIDGLEQRVAGAATEADRLRLASAVYHRYRLLGRLDDAERALALLDDPAAPVASAEGLMLRSVVMAGFHRFDEARAALDRIAPIEVDAAELRRHRDDLQVALGGYAALRDDFAVSMQPVGDLYQLAHRADLRVLLGDIDGAERQYWAAQTLYHDTSPVPLAWLHTQMGIALLRYDRIEEARRFFVAAVERLPGYYLAEEHLAECEVLLGEHDAARARYRRVIEQTGNPEFIAALAGLEAEAGNVEVSKRLREEARLGYETWLAKHPAAASQHAAEFFLETGDSERAYRLARDNLALRGDIGSRLLLAEAADASGRTTEACAQLGWVRDSGLRPPEFVAVAAISRRCAGAATEVASP